MRTEIAGPGYSSRASRTFTLTGRVLDALRLDGSLLLSVVAVCAAGLVVLYSAAGEDVHIFFGQAALPDAHLEPSRRELFCQNEAGRAAANDAHVGLEPRAARKLPTIDPHDSVSLDRKFRPI